MLWNNLKPVSIMENFIWLFWFENTQESPRSARDAEMTIFLNISGHFSDNRTPRPARGSEAILRKR